MKDTKTKPTNYNFNSIDLKLIKTILSDFGLNDKFILLPFVGKGENIKTLFFQSETSNKAAIRYKNKFLFLKEIPWYFSDENRIKNTYNTDYKLLYSISSKIPFLYKNITNNNYFSKTNRKFYILMEYIEGDEWDNSLKQAYNVGNELAKIHKNSMTHNKLNLKYYKSIYSSAEDMINLAKKRCLIKKLKTYTKELKDYQNITSIVYSDSTPSNYCFNGNNLKAIFDFDNLKYDNPVRDLAETIISFAIVKYQFNTSSYEKIFNPINLEISDNIIKGYAHGLNNKLLFTKIAQNLKSSIKIILLLFYSLAFLKDNGYKEKFEISEVKLDLIDKILTH